MSISKLLVVLTLATLAACEPGGAANVRVGGNAAIGISTGGSSSVAHRVGIGPPPGRTAAERSARRKYYAGPRGGDF